MGYFSDNIPKDHKVARQKAKEIMAKLMAAVKRMDSEDAERRKNIEATQNYYFDDQKNI